MSDKVILNQAQVLGLAASSARRIKKHYQDILSCPTSTKIKLCGIPSSKIKLYGIPRGGIPAAYAILSCLSDHFELVTTSEEADFFVDDIVGSGTTLRRYSKKYQGKPFFPLIDKRLEEDYPWVVFPWEENQEDLGPEDSIYKLIQFIGEDTERGGLKTTPRRVINAWKQWKQWIS